jgi:hypothetical protein
MSSKEGEKHEEDGGMGKGGCTKKRKKPFL